ncbi:MAG: tetratricopeptide repeat protein [Blastocatellia bacterium]
MNLECGGSTPLLYPQIATPALRDSGCFAARRLAAPILRGVRDAVSIGKRRRAAALQALREFGAGIVICMLLAPPAAAQPRPAAGEFERLSKQANAAREAERLDEAIALYLRALKLKPKWSEGWWYVGSMFYQRDQYREGRDAFRNLAAVDPKFGTAWTMLGLCQFQLSEYDEALRNLRHGNSFGFGDRDELRRVARYHEAILLNRAENYELAYDVLSRFMDKRSESPEVIVALGLAMLRFPYLPAAIPAAKREMVFKTGRAAYMAAINRVGDAQREYGEMIAAFSEEPGAHYAYGVFLLRDSPDAALAEFRRELKLSPNHVAARLQIAFEYIKRSEHAAGLPFAEEAVRLSPDLFAAHNALGRILLETGDLDRAIREMETGVRLAPDSPEMYFSLARAYARAKRPQDAARARAEFARLDKLRRAQRGEGAVSDGKP